jgi:N-acetylmuramoyl-L-alanine amidase
MAAGNHSETDGATNPASIKGMKIVIDAGHGGTESGTRGPNGLLEKGVCLEVALRLGQIIEDNLPGTDVIYTRSDDQSLSPQRRVAIANESDADLFISIHADSPADSQGLQVYYSAEDTKKESAASESGDAIGRASLQLAGDVESSLAQVFALKRETTPKPASAQPPFAILNGIHVPAIVAEIPFSENDSPLLDPAQRQRLAEGLYRGVATFLKGLQAGAHPRIRP